MIYEYLIDFFIFYDSDKVICKYVCRFRIGKDRFDSSYGWCGCNQKSQKFVYDKILQ